MNCPSLSRQKLFRKLKTIPELFGPQAIDINIGSSKECAITWLVTISPGYNFIDWDIAVTHCYVNTYCYLNEQAVFKSVYKRALAHVLVF